MCKDLLRTMRSAGHTLRSSSAVFPVFKRVYITLEMGGTGTDSSKLACRMPDIRLAIFGRKVAR